MLLAQSEAKLFEILAMVLTTIKIVMVGRVFPIERQIAVMSGEVGVEMMLIIRIASISLSIISVEMMVRRMLEGREIRRIGFFFVSTVVEGIGGIRMVIIRISIEFFTIFAVVRRRIAVRIPEHVSVMVGELVIACFGTLFRHRNSIDGLFFYHLKSFVLK